MNSLESITAQAAFPLRLLLKFLKICTGNTFSFGMGFSGVTLGSFADSAHLLAININTDKSVEIVWFGFLGGIVSLFFKLTGEYLLGKIKSGKNE